MHTIGEDLLPVLRLPELYDYFFEVGGGSGGGRHLQRSRWSEIHGIISEARGLGKDELDVLKAIAVLNLVASSGPLRASEELVLCAVTSDPRRPEERSRWRSALQRVTDRRVVTHRRTVDEYRLWQGSDFDIDEKLAERAGSDRRSLAELLSILVPLSPLVAQRHSYETGNLRYFERQYMGAGEKWDAVSSTHEGSDGIVVYWLAEAPPSRVPARAVDGKPIAVVHVPPSVALADTARELVSLIELSQEEVALQTDRVARGEVHHRINIARQVLEGALDDAMDRAPNRWLGGRIDRTRSSLTAALSRFCDATFSEGPVLWNELINRRELTSQGARAQRELIAAILTNWESERLDIERSGPEFSMYESLLRSTGIHRRQEGAWRLGSPTAGGLGPVWNAVEQYCMDSTDKPRSISGLYEILESPPYGVKRGIVPVILAAVLVVHSDDISVYQDGSFLPILAPPHFEVLVKDPARFAIKHFSLSGLRREVFAELEEMLRAGGAKRPAKARNATLLTVVRPLVRFAGELPQVTRKAIDLPEEAVGVRDALLGTREPDKLLFKALPEALGIEEFRASESMNESRRTQFKRGLLAALRQLQEHYDRVLERSAELIRTAFKVEGVDLREDLRVRAAYLAGRVIEPRLSSVVSAAADARGSDQEWLEALVMVIADRPAANWTRDDVLGFELKASDLGRRFLSLYALQSDSLQQSREGFEARRVTLTRSTGEYVEEIVWVDDGEKDAMSKRAKELLVEARKAAGSDQRLQALVVTMLQAVLEPATENEAAQPGNVSRKAKNA